MANELFQSDVKRIPFPMEPVRGAAWQPTHYTDGRPHAGLLSTSAFYEVWDTNNTNKNRRRANRWSIVFHCYNFLDTPVDVTRNVDNNDADAVLNAVTTRSDCKACHDGAVEKTVEEIKRFSRKDAAAFERFCEVMLSAWWVGCAYWQDHPTRPRPRPRCGAAISRSGAGTGRRRRSTARSRDGAARARTAWRAAASGKRART